MNLERIVEKMKRIEQRMIQYSDLPETIKINHEQWMQEFESLKKYDNQSLLEECGKRYQEVTKYLAQKKASLGEEKERKKGV